MKIILPCVYPKRCNQVCFYLDVLDRDWWFLLRHEPRSKHLFENNNVSIPRNEGNQGDSNEYKYVNVLFGHLSYGYGIFYDVGYEN